MHDYFVFYVMIVDLITVGDNSKKMNDLVHADAILPLDSLVSEDSEKMRNDQNVTLMVTVVLFVIGIYVNGEIVVVFNINKQKGTKKRIFILKQE